MGKKKRTRMEVFEWLNGAAVKTKETVFAVMARYAELPDAWVCFDHDPVGEDIFNLSEETYTTKGHLYSVTFFHSEEEIKVWDNLAGLQPGSGAYMWRPLKGLPLTKD